MSAIETLRPTAYGYPTTTTRPTGLVGSATSIFDGNLSTYLTISIEGEGTDGLTQGKNIRRYVYLKTFPGRTKAWTQGYLYCRCNAIVDSQFQEASLEITITSGGYQIYSSTNYTSEATTYPIPITMAQYDAGLEIHITGEALGATATQQGEPTPFGGRLDANLYEVWVEGTYNTDSFSGLTPATTTVAYGGQVTITPAFIGQAPTSNLDKNGNAGTAAAWGTWVDAVGQLSNQLTASCQFVFTQSTSGTTQTCNVTVRDPSVSAPVFSKNPVTIGETLTCSSLIANAASPYHLVTWSVVSGSGNWSDNQLTPTSVGTLAVRAASTYAPGYYNQSGLTVLAAPTASLTADVYNVPYGGTTTLRPVFTAPSGSGSLSNIGTIGSGVGYGTVAITASTTYTLTVTNGAGAQTTASVTLTPQTVSVSVSPANSIATQSGLGIVCNASVTGAADGSVTWSIVSGSGSKSTSGLQATFFPAGPGTTVLRATSVGNTSKYADWTITTYATPTISNFTCTPTNPLYGNGTVIAYTFAGGTGSLNQGGGAVSSGGSVTSGGLTAPLTFTLTVTNPAGGTVASSVLVTPQTVVVTAITGGGGYLSVGKTRSLLASVTGAANSNVAWTCTGGSFSPTTTSSGAAATWTAPVTPGSYTVYATSVGNGSTQTNTTVTVVALPVATSLVPSTATPLFGATISVVPTFSNGTGVVSQGVGTVVSGSNYGTAAITADTTFVLTVTNQAGDVVTTSVIVRPQVVSVGVGTTRTKMTINRNTSTLTAVVTNASNTAVNWSIVSGTGSLGSVTATTCVVTPLGAGTIVIRATSVGDPTKYKDTPIVIYEDTSATLSFAPDDVLKGTVAGLYPAFTNAVTAVIDQGIGTVVSGGNYSTGAINSAKTFTLTVTGTEGYTSVSSVTIRPVDALSSTAVAATDCGSAFLFTRQQFKVTASASPQNWGNILGGIHLMGFSQAVVSNGGQPAMITTQVRLVGIGQARPNANVPLTTQIVLQSTASCTPKVSRPNLYVPFGLARNIPAVYFQQDPNLYMQTLITFLDQEMGDLIATMDSYPRLLKDAAESKFVQDLLNHMGNPFKFQTNDTLARQLVLDLLYIYSQRGLEVGLRSALRYLLKQEIQMWPLMKTAWQVGTSTLGITTRLDAAPNSVVYWIELPLDFTPDQLQNLKSIVTFMAPPHVEFQYI